MLLQVGSRRRLVESLLQCMDRLDAAQSILNSCVGGGSGSGGETATHAVVTATAAAGAAKPSARSSQRSRLLK